MPEYAQIDTSAAVENLLLRADEKEQRDRFEEKRVHFVNE